jgi:hypothetical protein
MNGDAPEFVYRARAVARLVQAWQRVALRHELRKVQRRGLFVDLLALDLDGLQRLAGENGIDVQAVMEKGKSDALERMDRMKEVDV